MQLFHIRVRLQAARGDDKQIIRVQYSVTLYSADAADAALGAAVEAHGGCIPGPVVPVRGRHAPGLLPGGDADGAAAYIWHL